MLLFECYWLLLFPNRLAPYLIIPLDSLCCQRRVNYHIDGIDGRDCGQD